MEGSWWWTPSLASLGGTPRWPAWHCSLTRTSRHPGTSPSYSHPGTDEGSSASSPTGTPACCRIPWGCLAVVVTHPLLLGMADPPVAVSHLLQAMAELEYLRAVAAEFVGQVSSGDALGDPAEDGSMAIPTRKPLDPGRDTKGRLQSASGGWKGLAIPRAW